MWLDTSLRPRPSEGSYTQVALGVMSWETEHRVYSCHLILGVSLGGVLAREDRGLISYCNHIKPIYNCEYALINNFKKIT